MERFYITTPIYYVNARPHLGHAHTTILADAMARFHRVMGHDVRFLTGTDEHGDKIVKASSAAGQTPQAYCDAISALFKDLWPQLGVEYSQFIRTTDPEHKRLVQKALQQVYDAGDIYFGEYGGHYCFGCERFYTEKELVDGLCPDHKIKPEYIAEKNYFFRMAKYQQWLLDHIKANPEFIRPEQYRNEVVALLESGALEDLCISRPKSRLDWGVELPFDKDYVAYVWFDALLNYLTALGWPDSKTMADYWPHTNHLIAKDILKPHAVFWPTMLKAMGLEPYQHLNVHGYWLVKDTKMSKSLGNVVEPLALKDKYGLSGFRYFLLREMTFGYDSSFSEEALCARFNSDLANDLGNLFSRSLAMTHKYFDGRIPQAGQGGPDEDELRSMAKEACLNFQRLFERFQTAKALDSLWELVRGLNKYIDTQAPWTLYKEQNPSRLATVMVHVLECLRKVAAHLLPVMPEAAAAMLEQLGCNPDQAAINLPVEAEGWGQLTPGTLVAKASNLFPRIEAPAALAPEAAPKAKAPKPQPAPAAPAGPKEPIDFEDFQKLDLRVATVLEATPVPKADKLLLVKLDAGDPEPRQVVAGIAEFWKPEDLVGRQVVVVANLKPRKLRGVESQGMILAVKREGGLELLRPSEPVIPGSAVS
ncbi:methionine--tRNA ligase [Fundidesulfovibrio magnetotacticus]|uniref:methionine--tRNA ligase n=1 Tax=Fundidesulfovibrio magnetotacticus TaxID=2730080 RepID=UPI001563DF8B|nr:methionine--tRNA ligase [Fundidesulfovibrio magnetotacticus]